MAVKHGDLINGSYAIVFIHCWSAEPVANSGAKARVDLIGFSGPTEVVPLLQSFRRGSFSAACEVVPFHST